MSTLEYCYCSLFVTIIYLLVQLSKRRYRLCLPSIVYSFIWAVTSFLMICQSTGFLVNEASGESIFNQSAQFAFMLIIASLIGFTIAHIASGEMRNKKVQLIDAWKVNVVLRRFIWIPYVCGIIGVILIIFYLSLVGGTDNLGDYRMIAISAKKIGYMALIQRISGHINFLGTFFLMLLGYYYGLVGLNLKKFLFYFFLCSAINIAIAGRVWILSSTLPFIITFVFARKYSNNLPSYVITHDKKSLISIMVILISLFSLIGMIRNDNSVANNSSSYIRKFFYLTDGAQMTNLVLNEFPEGSYEKEYGMSTLASSFVNSPAKEQFDKLISSDIGLSVTVRSYMPPLYYDFGKWGGAIFWCILCILFEYWAILLKYKHTIFSIILMGQICMMFISTPIGNIVSLYTPAFEWLLIIYFLRHSLFRLPCNLKNIRPV